MPVGRKWDRRMGQPLVEIGLAVAALMVRSCAAQPRWRRGVIPCRRSATAKRPPPDVARREMASDNYDTTMSSAQPVSIHLVEPFGVPSR